MNREFRVQKGWRIFVWIIIPLIVALANFFLITEIPWSDFVIPKHFIIIAVVEIFCFIFILGIRDLMLNKFIIGADEIEYRSLFINRKLKLTDIEGFRRIDQYLIFYPKNKKQKKIRISDYFESQKEVSQWARENLLSLDMADYVEDYQQILSNEEAGFDKDERIKNLKKQRRIAGVYNFTSIIVSVLFLFVRSLDEILAVLCVLMPLISIVLLKSSDGLIRFNPKSKSPYPQVLSGFMFPVGIMGLFVIIPFNYLDLHNLVLPLILATLVIGTIIVNNKEFVWDFRKTKTYFEIAIFYLFAAGYCASSIMVINNTFLDDEASYYKSYVIEKGNNDSDHKSLTIKAWGKFDKPNDVSVSKRVYQNKDIGDEVTVKVRKGFFQISIYNVLND